MFTNYFIPSVVSWPLSKSNSLRAKGHQTNNPASKSLGWTSPEIRLFFTLQAEKKSQQFSGNLQTWFTVLSVCLRASQTMWFGIFAHSWNFAALMLLLHLFNIQVEIHFKIASWADIDWGTFALLWHRTKLRSWQMSLGETEFIPSPSVAEYKTISRVPRVASFQFLFSTLWTLCSSEKPDSLKLLFIVTYLGC